jgi:hypothetical protein
MRVSLLLLVVFNIGLYSWTKKDPKYLIVSSSNTIRTIIEGQSRFSKYILLMLTGVVANLLIGYLFNLNLVSIGWLISCWCWLMPWLWIWYLQYLEHQKQFLEITGYLNHFIACFKHEPTIYQTVNECCKICSGSLLGVLNKSAELIERGEKTAACKLIVDYCPHFIVHNLHQLVLAIENFGSLDYYEALDNIQNDLEDWMEDTLQFQQLQQTLNIRLWLLSGFAIIIALMVKIMLVNAMIDVNSDFYQWCMILFGIAIHLTIGMSQRLLHHSWMADGEMIC